MSKCHVEQICEVYRGIFEDATVAFPHLKHEFIRDYERVLLIASSRGMFGLAVDLPRFGKHFDRCLSDGKYTSCGLPFTRPINGKKQIPRFLGGLLLLVFDDEGTLREHADVEAILFVRQVLYLAKKVELQCRPEAVIDEIEDFLAMDNELPEPKDMVWDAQNPGCSEAREVYRGFGDSTCSFSAALSSYGGPLLGRYLDFVFGYLLSTLGRYEPSEWRCKHGPGAIAAKSGPANKYQWYSWPNRLDSRFPISEYGYYSHSSYLRNLPSLSAASEEEASRLIAVRKTLDKPRLIAAEPNSHQWCQQNIWHYFRTRVEDTEVSSFLNFRSQERNQRLCRKGSRDGSLATLDLSSASDRVTCEVVGQAFRSNPELLLHLAACRTRYIRVNHPHHGEFVHRLNKFSTMGSACTFPVESLIFLGISIAAILHCRRAPMHAKAIRDLTGCLSVFGDDIIVPSDTWKAVKTTLEILLFKVNDAKSYAKGFFRESCGVDAFEGVDVTPVYWRRLFNGKPESVASTIDTRNHFYQRWFQNTCRVLERTIGEVYHFPYVRSTSGVVGFLTYLEPHFTHVPKVRWNAALQIYQARLPTFRGKVTKQRADDDSSLHQFFTERPDPMNPWTAGTVVNTSTKLRLGWVPLELLVTYVKDALRVVSQIG